MLEALYRKIKGAKKEKGKMSSSKINLCVICKRPLDEVFDLKKDKKMRVTCNKLHAKYLQNVRNYIQRMVRKKLDKIKHYKRTEK